MQMAARTPPGMPMKSCRALVSSSFVFVVTKSRHFNAQAAANNVSRVPGKDEGANANQEPKEEK